MRNRVAEPVWVSMGKAKTYAKTIAKSVDEFQVEYHMIMSGMMVRARQGVVQSVVTMGRSIRSVVRFSIRKVRTTLRLGRKKIRATLRLWINWTMNALRGIENRLDDDNANGGGNLIAKDANTGNSLATGIKSFFTSSSSSPSPTSSAPSSAASLVSTMAASPSPTWLLSSSSKRSDAQVPTKQKKKKIPTGNSVMMEQLATGAAGQVDSSGTGTTDVEAVPSPSLLGGMYSTLLTGLFFVAGGVMVGYFWNDWRDVRTEAASRNDDFVDVRIADDGSMTVTTMEAEVRISDDGSMIVTAAVVEQDGPYAEMPAMATLNPITPEPVRY